MYVFVRFFTNYDIITYDHAQKNYAVYRIWTLLITIIAN